MGSALHVSHTGHKRSPEYYLSFTRLGYDLGSNLYSICVSRALYDYGVFCHEVSISFERDGIHNHIIRYYAKYVDLIHVRLYSVKRNTYPILLEMCYKI